MTINQHTDTRGRMTSYPVHEAFSTLQGEGFHTGRAAYFIRLAGCDVGCHWCDVKSSWEVNREQWEPLEDILKGAEDAEADLAVITGGEPSTYDLTTLTAGLKDRGYSVHIETSGVYPIRGNPDWITLSPKKFKDCLPENFERADELKIVIFHPSDLYWADELAQNVRKDCKLYLQPEWSRADRVTPVIIDHIRSNPQWRISLQTHKYLNIR